jgi:hypothetical protein
MFVRGNIFSFQQRFKRIETVVHICSLSRRGLMFNVLRPEVAKKQDAKEVEREKISTCSFSSAFSRHQYNEGNCWRIWRTVTARIMGSCFRSPCLWLQFQISKTLLKHSKGIWFLCCCTSNELQRYFCSYNFIFFRADGIFFSIINVLDKPLWSRLQNGDVLCFL